MKTVEKTAVNPDTRQSYLLTMPAPEPVRQAIVELEYPPDGIRVVVATEELAKIFQLSNEQKDAKNISNLNVFGYDVVAPQFRWLLGKGKLVQPEGPKTPYFLTKHIKTLEEFIEWTKEFIYGEYVFRGVSNEAYEIEASTYRRLKDKDGKFYNKEDNNPKKILEINKEMLEAARRQGHGTKDGLPLKDLDLLAELQHLGAATCLIDFTHNPLVALRMACREGSRGKVNGKVYAIDLNSQDTTFKEVTVKLAQEKNIDCFFCDKKGEYNFYQWHPNYQNNRMRAQQSIFLFSGSPIKSDMDCIISKGKKQEIRDDLEQSVGLTEKSLFPDFEGFASQLAHTEPYVNLDAQYCFDKGLKAETKDNRKLAITHYTRGIPLNPDKNLLSRLYHNRASCYINIRKFKDAIGDYNKLIELNPDSHFLYYSRGKANIHLEQYKDAVTDYNAAIHINPNYVEAYLDRGKANIHLKQYEEAIKDYNAAIHINPNYAQAYLDRGKANVHLEQYEEASQSFQTALQFAEQDDNEELVAEITKNLDELKKLMGKSFF